MKFIQSIVLCLFSLSLFAQTSFSGVFNKVEGEFKYFGKANWDLFSQHHQEQDSLGFRLIDVEAHKMDGTTLYWGIWKKDTIESQVHLVEGWTGMVKMKRKMYKEGYKLDDVEAYLNDIDHIIYLGVWSKVDEKHKIWKLDSWAGLLKKNEEMEKDYMILIDVEPFMDDDGTQKFLAVYQPGGFFASSHVYTSDDMKAFNLERMKRRKSGYRIVDFESYKVDGKELYLCIYHQGEYEESFRHNLNEASFRAHQKNYLETEGLQLIDIEVFVGEGKWIEIRAVK